MHDSNSSLPAPVDGVIFGRPLGKTFGLVVLAAGLFLFGAFLIWAKVSEELFGLREGERGITLYGLVVGICALISSPFMLAHLLRSFWVKHRLMVAPDRLQIVERLGGQDIVMLQIPFANIASVQYEATESMEARVGIDLNDPDDPGTYAGSKDFKASKNVLGRHFCIGSWGYRGGPKVIAAEIEQAIKRWSGTT